MITRNSDNLALYGDDWELVDDCAFNSKRNIRDKKINLSNATFHNVKQPKIWSGGFYTYDGADFVLTSNGLDAAKEAKKSDLKLKFTEISERPIVDTGLGFNAQGGYQDLANLQTSIYLDKDEPLYFRDADNVTHEVTKVEFKAILDAVIANGARLMHVKWDLSDAIEAAKTEAELNAIDINAGW